MAAAAATDLPVLDLSLLDRGGSRAEEFRTALRAASHDVGFFHLVGHGVPEDVTARAFAEAEPDKWYWFEGNFDAYEDNKVERLGPDAAKPHRVTHRRLTRG